MPSIQSPRGTRDILPQDQPLWQTIQQTAVQIAEQMSFRPISTPTYEEIGLFQRSIGKGTDVMDKELFLVRGIKTEIGKEEYALRPEGTAGIVRAFIEHGMHTWPQPVKLYSIVNNFRYDRPQKGRYREHTQFDVEYFGDKSPFADAWVIYFSWRFLKHLGLKQLKLQLNTLGTGEERAAYITALKDFLEPRKSELSEDSQRRLQENPLRILDSKEAKDQLICQSAPSFSEFLKEESPQHFAKVQEYLTAWQVPFSLNPAIVRGLDYYAHTTFEWIIEGENGQQNSLGGGGRYDQLLPQLGGPDIGGVGAGLGLDRIFEAMRDQQIDTVNNNLHPELFLVAADSVGAEKLPRLITELLEIGWSLDTAPQKESMGAQMKAASRSEALAALIIGQKEVEENTVVVKQLASGSQETVSRTDLRNYLREHLLDHTTCDCCTE